MKKHPGKKSKAPTRAKSLTKVLDESERVKTLMKQSAEDLSSVNTMLNKQLSVGGKPPQLEEALEKNEAVEGKVQEATDKLSVVNQALEHEVQERQLLEHQLAAAVEQEEAARHTAFHDPLTGLPNRILFNDRLEHGLEQAKRHARTLAIMFVDLDEFKNINDTYGHAIGDAVLQLIAERLKENTRGDDTVCRHGGDEFLYLLMEVGDEADISLLATKIIDAIQEPCDLKVPDAPSTLTIKASIGIAVFPKNGDTAEQLIQSADKAMYQAKRAKTGFVFA